jgi:hypothetical protein
MIAFQPQIEQVSLQKKNISFFVTPLQVIARPRIRSI